MSTHLYVITYKSNKLYNLSEYNVLTSRSNKYILIKILVLIKI